MSRLSTMARFDETVPDDPQVFGYCACCGDEIYVGDCVYEMVDGKTVLDGHEMDYLRDLYVERRYVAGESGE